MKLNKSDKNTIKYERIINRSELSSKIFKKNSIKSFTMNNKINIKFLPHQEKIRWLNF